MQWLFLVLCFEWRREISNMTLISSKSNCASQKYLILDYLIARNITRGKSNQNANLNIAQLSALFNNNTRVENKLE